MLERREELEAFKRDINLIEYAASFGYELDRKASSRTSVVMRHADGDKVVIARAAGGHWTFFSVRDDRDNGTIIDFLQHRRALSLGEVRQELRHWLPGAPGAFRPAFNQGTPLPSLPPAPANDLNEVRARYEAMQPLAGHHPYLESERAIPADVLAHPRFVGCIRTDTRGNAVFPHVNQKGLCGYELKNSGFTGFAPGGTKGLWRSVTWPDDQALVITESAIDALSHFALRRPAATAYVSIAGSLNHTQPDLLRQAAATLPAAAVVILATDNDAGGRRLAATIRDLLAPLEGHVRLFEDCPAVPDADWNDLLRTSSRARSGR